MESIAAFASNASHIIGGIAASYVVADVLTGVVHWAEDTYAAPGRSKFLDTYVVLDNLEHHRRPGSIRGDSYWLTNRTSLCIAAPFMLLLFACGIREWHVFLTLAMASQGNQVHKWAHSSRRPALVRRLQDCGILQSRRHHGLHHVRPYATRFCALGDFVNPVLDGIGFWRRLEDVIATLGARPMRGSAARGGL